MCRGADRGAHGERRRVAGHGDGDGIALLQLPGHRLRVHARHHQVSAACSRNNITSSSASVPGAGSRPQAAPTGAHRPQAWASDEFTAGHPRSMQGVRENICKSCDGPMHFAATRAQIGSGWGWGNQGAGALIRKRDTATWRTGRQGSMSGRRHRASTVGSRSSRRPARASRSHGAPSRVYSAALQRRAPWTRGSSRERVLPQSILMRRRNRVGRIARATHADTAAAYLCGNTAFVIEKTHDLRGPTRPRLSTR